MTSNSELIEPVQILKQLGLNNPQSIEAIKGGLDSLVWRVVSSDAQVYALRLLRSDQTVTAQGEVAAMQTALKHGISVPIVFECKSWRERPVLLLEWCRGRNLLEEMQSRLWRLWQLGVLFGQTQAAIHKIDAPLPLQNSQSSFLSIGAVDQQLDTALQNCNLRTGILLHGDYHPLNILSDGARITGVLDWTNTFAGDPRFDLARTVSLLRLSPIVSKTNGSLLFTLRLILEFAWRTGYRQAHGQFKDLALFYVWAGLAMERDLTPKLGHRPGLTDQDIQRIRNWTNKWKRKARL